MGERAQVARGPDRTLTGDEGMNARVQQPDEAGERSEADARVPPAERVDPQQHDGARDVHGVGLSDPAGVAAQQVLLKCGAVLPRYPHRGQVPKPRRDAVDHPVGLRPALHESGGPPDGPNRVLSKAHRIPMPRDAHDVVQLQ